MSTLLNVGVALIPVLVFLYILFILDTFKLLRRSTVLAAILSGTVVAVVCFVTNRYFLGPLAVDPVFYSRYAAPVLEEALKAAPVLLMIRIHRIGFLVDAAIFGFAAGTGFAVVENVYYLGALDRAELLTWIVRGFGTAVIHGSNTAIFGILAKLLFDRWDSAVVRPFLIGLVPGVVIHSLFNHFILPPLLATGLILIVMPLLLIVVFESSEKSTRDWLGVSFDSDIDLMEQLTTGEIGDTRVGKYLDSLQDSLPPAVVADLFCYLQIHLELSMRAKGLLIARQAGLEPEPDPVVEASFRELEYLRKTVGRAGVLAISPFLNMKSRDLWQLHMLRK
ncbi:MAG: PrsW family intramembrane metalloprotease [Gemmatimonadetes bacterium]|nr:PrsW family intramembrane metalloprotease [Gemmatimonadota bacterium]